MRPIDGLTTRFRLSRAMAAARPFETYARLYREDQAAFLAEKHDLTLNAGLEPFISRTLAEYALSSISNKLTLKLARRLCGAGRHEEATALLLDARFTGAPDSTFQLTLAMALAGVGRIDDALAAARRSREMDPANEEPAALAARLDDLARSRAEAEVSPRWAPQAHHLHGLIEAGAWRPALNWLQQRLIDGFAPAPQDMPGVYATLQTLLTLLEGGNTRGLFRALARRCPDPAAAADLARIAGGLRAAVDAPVAGDWVSDAQDLHVAGALAWAAAGRRKAAIDALGALTRVRPNDGVVRGSLARAVGQEVTGAHPFSLAGPGGGRIFDVFPFHDEIDMLGVKLGSMAGWVDHFVIVESRTTFAGHPKPLHFEANRERFAAFADKIVHVVVDGCPEHVNRHWSREFYQRDMALRGLTGRCAEDDLVLITDVDEIVAEPAVRSFTGECARLLQEQARFFLNYREALSRDQQRGAASIWRAKHLQSMTPSYLRIMLTADKKAACLPDAGWHFTSVGDPKRLVNKLINSSHQEIGNPGEDVIRKHIDAIRAGRTEPGWERCELDERFPPYIRAARRELADLIL